MNKIKQWLRRWLGVEEDKKLLFELNEKVKNVDKLNEIWCNRLENRLSKTENIIGKTIRAGFDHHIRQPHWIVLAWREDNGREHVHFYEVHKEYISQINDTLRSLKRENVFVNTNPQILPQFKW